VPAAEVTVRLHPDASGVVVGAIAARGCAIQVANTHLDDLIAEAARRVDQEPPSSTIKSAVRDMLRHGRYKPTGRGKPASEYLVRSATQGRFPRINNLVDALNVVSLDSGLPISILDVQRAGATAFVIRRGRAGERYVFNQGGQEIDLQDLLLVATDPGDQPCANPVKDSMATKLVDATSDVLAVIYGPATLSRRVHDATDRLESLIVRVASPKTVSTTVLSAV